jgi:prevent-host-death family protein
MRTVTATEAVRDFSALLGLVEHGQTVRIMRRGRPVARISPEVRFMTGKEAAALFRDHKPDPETADAIAAALKQLREEDNGKFSAELDRPYRRSH